MIAPTALIDEPCSIGDGTKVWHFAHVCRGAHIGEDCTIAERVYIGPNVTIGKDCKIENGAQIFEGVTLGDSVFIGPNVTFTNDILPVLIDSENWKQDGRFQRTTVRDNVSIGANATILAGVTLHAGCIVGCGAVVTRDVPENTIVAGNPATVIRTFRSQAELLAELNP